MSVNLYNTKYYPENNYQSNKELMCYHCGKHNENDIVKFKIFPRRLIKQHSYFFNIISNVTRSAKMYLCKQCLKRYIKEKEKIFPNKLSFFQWLKVNNNNEVAREYYELINTKRKLKVLQKVFSVNKSMSRENIYKLLNDVKLKELNLEEISIKISYYDLKLKNLKEKLIFEYNSYMNCVNKESIEAINNGINEYIKKLNPIRYPKFTNPEYQKKIIEIIQRIGTL